MSRPAILAIGTACPPQSVSQEQAMRVAASRCGGDHRQVRILERLYRATRVDRRGSVLTDTMFYPPAAQQPRGPTTAARMAAFECYAPPLAGRAAGAAIEGAAVQSHDITHMVTVTCTGFVSPGVEHRLIETLGLSAQVQRVQVGFMGCHAALNALRVAAALANADRRHHVLVCCVELCTLHFQYGWDEQKMVANALFADGAAAAIVGHSDAAPQILASGSQIIPGTGSQMTWTIGDHGFEMTLSPRVPQIIAGRLQPWLDEMLGQQGLTVPQVGGWCIHAGGPRIVSTVAERLGVNGTSTQASHRVLRDHGNMSSATVLFVLQQMIEQRLPRPWVMLAFGPGLTAEAMLLG
jgi:predicted naringenin-chalcone synthase